MSPCGIPVVQSRYYRLNKAIYGLKQAHLECHTKLCGDLQELVFEELPSAPCVFRHSSGEAGWEFVLVYIDDLLVLARSISVRDAIVEELQALYELRMSEGVELFLVVQLKRTRDFDGGMIALNMGHPLYVESVLCRFGLESSKPSCTPMVESFFAGVSWVLMNSSTNI